MSIDPQKIRPPHFILAYILLAVVLQVTLKPGRLIARPYHWSGLIVLAVGIGIMARANRLFTQHDTPVPHSEKPRAVVTGGPYRFSRNPMYVAGAFIFLGIALLAGTWPFFAAWLLMGLTLDRLFIPWEEKRMEKLFGQDYLNYKKGTRRWI